FQTQKAYLGVIGSTHSPTFEAVIMAVQRFAPDGKLVGPGGSKLSIEVVSQDAATPEEVGNAVIQFKTTGVIAIFGPDYEQLVVKSINALSAAGVPFFTGATTTAFNAGGFIFRTRASDDRQMAVLAEVLLKDLQRTALAVFQGNANVETPARDLNSALS